MGGRFPVDDWGGVDESFVFASNFYDETDDVTRNVNIDSVALGTQSAFDGDFCDVFYQDWHSSLQKSLGFKSAAPDPDSACTGDLCTEEVDSETLLPSTSARFLAGDIPPSVPSTPFFKLLPTTLHIPSMSALDVANALFTICTSRGWSVVKVNRASSQSSYKCGKMGCHVSSKSACTSGMGAMLSFRDEVVTVSLLQPLLQLLEPSPSPAISESAVVAFTRCGLRARARENSGPPPQTPQWRKALARCVSKALRRLYRLVRPRQF